MIPCLSQVCSLNSSFEDDITDYAAGQCHEIELWLTKLESYLQKESVSSALQLLEANGVRARAASYQGGLMSGGQEARQVAWQLFERRIELCLSLNIGTIVVACDTRTPFSAADLDTVKGSLQQAARLAEQHGVRVALEFQAGAAFGNNLQTAVAHP